MSRRLTNLFELLLLMVVLISLGLGVNWTGNQVYATQPTPQASQEPVAQNDTTQAVVPVDTPTPAAVVSEVTPAPTELALTETVVAPVYPVMTGTIGPLPPSPLTNPSPFTAEPGDAPLPKQAPRTPTV